MADEENNEPKKRGGLVKILLFAFGGVVLIGIGLGVGFVLFLSNSILPVSASMTMADSEMMEGLKRL